MSSSLQTYAGTLAAGARITLPARGNFIYLRTAVNPLLVTMTLVALGSQTGRSQQLRMYVNDKVNPAQEFDSVVILNDSAAAVTYEFLIGDGNFERPLPDVVNVVVNTPTSSVLSSTADDDSFAAGNANAVAVLPANTSRLRAIITALTTNANVIRIGDADVDVDRGTPLAAGETIAIDTKGAIYVCSEAGVATDNAVALLEETL